MIISQFIKKINKNKKIKGKFRKQLKFEIKKGKINKKDINKTKNKYISKLYLKYKPLKSSVKKFTFKKYTMNIPVNKNLLKTHNIKTQQQIKKKMNLTDRLTWDTNKNAEIIYNELKRKKIKNIKFDYRKRYEINSLNIRKDYDEDEITYQLRNAIKFRNVESNMITFLNDYRNSRWWDQIMDDTGLNESELDYFFRKNILNKIF